MAMIGATPVAAFDLSLPPNADLTREIVEDMTVYLVPIGRFQDGTIPGIRVEGERVQQAWQFDALGLTSSQIMRPLREQLVAVGQEILLDCAAQGCGGFDFRFGTDVLPAPDILIDLFDYRFVSSRAKGKDGQDVFTTILVSRVGSEAYVQIIRAVQADTVSAIATETRGGPVSERVADVVEGEDRVLARLRAALLRDGHIILSDLDFGSGSEELGPGPFETLNALAAFLREDAARRVALVGHSDTVGGFDANLRLSRRRAQTVLERLVASYGIARDRLEANGAAYLAPLSSNLTPEGRERNRRVEVVYLNSGR